MVGYGAYGVNGRLWSKPSVTVHFSIHALYFKYGRLYDFRYLRVTMKTKVIKSSSSIAVDTITVF